MHVCRVAYTTVNDVVNEERGREVAGKLGTKAREALTDKIALRVAAALLLRVGLESALASTVVGLILPFVVEYAVRRLSRTQTWTNVKEHEKVVALRNQVRNRFRLRAKELGAQQE